MDDVEKSTQLNKQMQKKTGLLKLHQSVNYTPFLIQFLETTWWQNQFSKKKKKKMALQH